MEDLRSVLSPWGFPRDLYAQLKDYIGYNNNDPEIMLCTFPDVKWDYVELSKHPALKTFTVERRIHCKWNYSLLVGNMELTKELIVGIINNRDTNPCRDLSAIYKNKSLTVRLVIDTMDRLRWDFCYLSRHLPLHDIKANPSLPWEWDIISERMIKDYQKFPLELEF